MRARHLLASLLIFCACQKTSTLEWNGALGKAEPLGDPMKILQARCLSCHNSIKHEGDFSKVNDLQAMVNEGYIVPGNPEESRLYVLMRTRAMPPDSHLDEEEVENVRKWIAYMDPYMNDTEWRWPHLESDVLRPLCWNCHAAGTALPFSTYEEVIPYVVVGQHSYSLFYEAVLDGTPEHSTIDGVQRKVIREWINRGARR